jgi:hypothetical protein
LANSLLAAWRDYRRRRGAAREVITLALGLLAGLVLLPLAIYVGGQLILGPYVRSPTDATPAGPLALWTDFLAGLSQGSLAHWLVLLGPYVMYLLWRLARRSRRA